MASPLVPTLALQVAAVLCIVTAATAGRYAETHRSPTAGALCVLALFTTAGLLAVLLARMGS